MMLEMLQRDFHGDVTIHKKVLLKTPKYGNDNDYADEITSQVFDLVYNAIENRPNTKGGRYHINLLPTTVHIYFGKVTGATPDGRRANMPLSEGISPVQGMDINGPTAVLKSAGKIDHVRTGGTLLNQKFAPEFLNSDEGINKIVDLIRAYFEMGGHHIQFNVVSAETLRKAQLSPELYRDLIVRVAGYSDYFINLGVDLQNEIIQRTEHTFC
jgi:pyruvate-formate lyase